MSQKISTTREVIDALGGNGAVANITGSTAKAVWNWRKANIFPAHTYLLITNALKRRGLIAPSGLWRMSQATSA